MITIRDNHYTLEDVEYMLILFQKQSDRNTCDNALFYSCDNCPRKRVCADMRYTLKHLEKSYVNKFRKTDL